MPYLRGLAWWRDQRLFSQSDLAKLAKLRLEDIRRFERGEQRAQEKTIRRLANILGVTQDDLISPPPVECYADQQVDRQRRLQQERQTRERPTYTIEYPITLSAEGDYLRIGINTYRGEVVSFRVQYETTVAGQEYPVVRCDCAHGYAHCDILDGAGRNVEKVDLPRNLSYKEALQWALHDLRSNWRRQRARFLERLP